MGVALRQGVSTMFRATNCVPTSFCSVIFCIFASTALGAQDHKHAPVAPSGNTDTKAPAPAAISLADLEQLALQHNPTLAQAALQVEAARGKALQAGLYPNPTVGYTGELIGA